MKRIAGTGLPACFVSLGLLGCLAAAGCGDDGDGKSSSPQGSVFVEKAGGDDQEGGTGRELPEPIVVRVHDGEGNGIQGETVTFTVTGGGGSVSEPSVATDRDGIASVRWTMGPPPVWNRLRASAGGDEAEFRAWANLGERPALDLVFQGASGVASEDLAFEEGRGLFLGTPGAILNIPSPGSNPVPLELAGGTVESAAGIAFGPSGDLYVCENGPSGTSVKRIQPSGVTEILSQGFGGQPFALPNYVAVHSSGDIYLSSSCDDMIYRILPATGETTTFLSIVGPNGLAFDAQEEHLYVLTENPFVFCIPGPSVRAGLFRVPFGPGGEAGEVETLIDDFALAGDGLAFDEEGNLYTVFSGAIESPGGGDDSGVFVYTPDGRFNEFFVVDVLGGEIITNVAFGVEPFDPYSLYGYGFTGKLYRVEVGIRGKTLP
jgi:sugar lactone lactonase YvrE